ncbi:MAG: aminotransferase class V-fold PLP-dependent enzyme [Microcystis aeruginosa L211-101]|jgi:cysteine desulfurase|nr:aminotransferase class V-fold PLP-dependent enzyme [Microcystis aeruginosa L211-11]NCR31570.1 aminotransferase class V-fold PLP-dependent enzyme [Microcystis aeruginosa L211-101]
MQIYLDYSATTPTHPQVIERVATILRHHWGNPSSLHTWGQDTATVIEMAREQVAGLINANPDQIIFTSGGTAIKLKLISPPVNRRRLVLMLRRKNKNSWVGNVAASHNPLIIYSPFCLFPILTDN